MVPGAIDRQRFAMEVSPVGIRVISVDIGFRSHFSCAQSVKQHGLQRTTYTILLVCMACRWMALAKFLISLWMGTVHKCPVFPLCQSHLMANCGLATWWAAMLVMLTWQHLLLADELLLMSLRDGITCAGKKLKHRLHAHNQQDFTRLTILYRSEGVLLSSRCRLPECFAASLTSLKGFEACSVHTSNLVLYVHHDRNNEHPAKLLHTDKRVLVKQRIWCFRGFELLHQSRRDDDQITKTCSRMARPMA
jgi:hypothetical protein